MKNFKYVSIITIAMVLVCIGMVLVMSACEDDGGSTTYSFVCEHGIETDGTADDKDITKCSQCDSGYKLVDEACMPTSYTCQHGTPADGSPDGNQDVARCSECDTNYVKSGDSCIADIDNDGTPNSDDIDDDNNGLIEISSLEALHNIRYDLTGASYDDEADDGTGNEGNTSGAPTASNKADDYVCGSTATGTCGYELTANLSFDADDDGSSWSESGGDYTLDSDDDNDNYFDVDNGGWMPIGDADNGFAALFDGNNHTITGLAIRRSDTLLGLFGVIADGSTIQNLNIADSLTIYTGSDNTSQIAIVIGSALGDADDATSQITITNVHIIGTSRVVGSDSVNAMGGLVGFAEGTTIAFSSSSTELYDGKDEKDRIGGLVGAINNGLIVGSYATGDVNGGMSKDFNSPGDDIGGLVGHQDGGSIIASYATGSVHGSSGWEDNAGSLVGQQLGGTITASYATGSVDGGAGSFDRVGGLIGWKNGNANVTQSYATGNVSGGSGSGDYGGKLVGRVQNINPIQSASYGFGTLSAENTSNGVDAAPITDSNAPDPAIPSSAAGLTSDYFSDAIASNAWSFSDGSAPKLLYTDYDGDGTDYSCSTITRIINGTEVTLTCGSSELAGQ